VWQPLLSLVMYTWHSWFANPLCVPSNNYIFVPKSLNVVSMTIESSFPLTLNFANLYSLYPIILDAFDKTMNIKKNCEELAKMAN
jgi:hypothetical protein